MDAIEKRARERLDTELRKLGLHEDAYHVGCGADLDRNDQAAINAIAAALTPPEGYVLVPVELPDMGGAPGFAEGNYSRSNWHAAIADLQWLAARPEVP